MLINAVLLKRANDETSSYMSAEKATKSYRFNILLHMYFINYLFSSRMLFCYREQLNKQISSTEARIKANREKQKVTKDVQIDGTRQLKYWRDLLRMMELKRKLTSVFITLNYEQ